MLIGTYAEAELRAVGIATTAGTTPAPPPMSGLQRLPLDAQERAVHEALTALVDRGEAELQPDRGPRPQVPVRGLLATVRDVCSEYHFYGQVAVTDQTLPPGGTDLRSVFWIGVQCADGTDAVLETRVHPGDGPVQLWVRTPQAVAAGLTRDIFQPQRAAQTMLTAGLLWTRRRRPVHGSLNCIRQRDASDATVFAAAMPGLDDSQHVDAASLRDLLMRALTTVLS